MAFRKKFHGGSSMTRKTVFLTIAEAAELLGVSPSTIRSWVRDRKISYRKIGKFVRFTDEDLESFVVSKERF